MTAPNTIVDLVERYRRYAPDYTSTSYNETQVRHEFIDPLFEALGWDINNKQGNAEAYKDVIHEDAIKIGGTTKAPDYAFRIGGTRKFFLEAKKPSISIKNGIGPAYQLRRYAWSAKLPLSVLTDFEEFAVYDCRIMPKKGDKASVARINYYTFDKYAEKWDEIESVFSREAILKGSFDKYVDGNKRRRGTAEVDSAFLEEIENWRTALARNIAFRNPTLSIRELNMAVQRTIDRIIFLRIAEDRGIETYGQLQALKNGKDVYKNLAQLFRGADDRYNSGLFHFRKGDGSDETVDTFTLDLDIADKTLAPILGSLYYPESPYEFSVLPADILGQIYERFLGKVIRFSGRRIVIEERPEVKKAGGVYYTPTHIVQYIVENTLAPLLKDRTPAQISGSDKRMKDSPPLRVLDPACGSGSFLLEAYRYLLAWYQAYYIEGGPEKHAKGKEPKLLETTTGDWCLTLSERRRILLTHIYGVDIDPQAVEVTKLSLLLKVLEGEDMAARARQREFFRVRALPDLGNNIRCGNSLIKPDFYDMYSMSLFSEDDHMNLNTFDWETEFPFLEKTGGFDIVIGNPPYLYSAGQSYAHYFEEKYRFSQYQTDFYVYFTERGLNLLRPGGALGYIIPDSWLNSDSFSVMRNNLTSQWATMQICIFDYKVFRDANIENTIFIAKNQKPTTEIDIIKFLSPTEYSKFNNLTIEDIKRIGRINPYYTKEAESIINHLDSFEILGDMVLLNRGIHAYRTDGYGKTAFGTGPQTKKDKELKSYHASSAKDSTFLPEIRGRDVFWLRYQSSGKYISYGEWLAEPRDPKFIMNPKVVFRKTLGSILSAAFIREPAAVDQALYISISKDGNEDILKFVLGTVASSVGAWYLRTKYAIYDRLHPWYTKKQLENFPIPQYSETIVAIVDELLSVCEKGENAKIEQERRFFRLQKQRLQDKLDRTVFDAYELSEEERNFIQAETFG